MCGGVSGPLTELWKGVGLWPLGIERLSRSLWRDICLPCFCRVCGWVGMFLLVFLCVGCYHVSN